MEPEFLLYKYLQLRGAKVRRDVCNGIPIHSVSLKPRASRSRNQDVVVLHGIGSSGAHFVQAILGIAALGYTVHVPDLPGHGMSGEHPECLTAHELFETLNAWMEVVAPKKFSLIGNSLGGALAWRFAGYSPERINKLVLLSPAVGFSSNEIWETFRDSLAIPNLKTARSFINRIVGKPSILDLFILIPIFRNMNRKAVRDILETTKYSEVELQNHISEIMVPTLLVWGNQDDLLPRSNLDWIKQRMPKHVELLEPEGIGHCPQMDSPSWLKKILKDALP